MPSGRTVVDCIIHSWYPLVFWQQCPINISILVDMSNREFGHDLGFVANSEHILHQFMVMIRQMNEIHKTVAAGKRG